MAAPLKLVEAKNIELTVEPDKLQYQTRKELGREYFKWLARIEGLKAKYYGFVAIDALVLFAAFIIDLSLMFALIVLIPMTLKAQFDYGDKLDDKQIWEGKYVTRVDCFESSPE
ncbi:MAG: hypothetical protein ABIE23_06555 [archaeon]